MSMERFDELMAAWEDGEISPEELDELCAILEEDPGARARVVSEFMVTGEIVRSSRVHEARGADHPEDAVAAEERPAGGRRPSGRTRRGRWSWALWGAMAAGLLMAAGAYYISARPRAVVASVASVSGGVGIERGEKPVAAEAGMELRRLDVVTVAEGASARVAFVDGAGVLLNGSTRAVFLGGGVALERGEVYCRVAHAGKASFAVRTEHAVITDLGTAFGVKLDAGRARVVVAEGEVECSNDHGRAVVSEGQQSVISSSSAPPESSVADVGKVLAWTGEFKCRPAMAAATSGPRGATAGPGDVKLRVVKGDETGLGKIMSDWHDSELARSGGKFGSHGWWPWGLRAFDFDLDGDLDLIPSHHGGAGSLIIKSRLVETGRLSFVDVTRDLVGDNRSLPGADDRPWIWDFDGDGWLDIAGMSDESRPSSFFNKGGAKLVKIESFSFRPLSHPKEIADLNGDGRPDVDGGGRGRWIYGPAARSFKHDKEPVHGVPEGVPEDIVNAMVELKKQKGNRFLRASYLTHASNGYDTLGYSPRPIDLNSDGRGDVVVAASGGYGAAYRGRYLIGEDGGRFVDRTKEMGLPETGAATMVMDLTGDGAPEVLIVGKGTGGVYVNDGKGSFARVEGDLTKFLQKRGPYLLRAFRVDLDNDGDWDLVMSNPRYGREEIHENKGGGRFRKILAVGGWDSNPVVTCDINNDGRMDVVIGGAGKQEITVYLNETPHAGKHADIHPRMAAPNPYAVGAVVEAYWAGDLGRKGAVPIVTEKAHWDATPVHVGLGEEAKFDLRVKFPDGTVVEKRGVDSGKRWKVTPDGPLEDMDGGGRGGEASPHRGSVDR